MPVDEHAERFDIAGDYLSDELGVGLLAHS
jgi:hypothetical protein